MNKKMKHNISKGIINTYSGLQVDLLNPTVDMIDIRDIAKGLAYKAHFAGQTPFYFSIAQHSTLVYDLMCKEIIDDKMLLLALLHDASEAYIGDMVKPLKNHLPFFREVEDKLMEAICERYDLDFSRIHEVKKFDLIAQDLEFKTFYEGEKFLNSLSPDESLKEFLNIFFLY